MKSNGEDNASNPVPSVEDRVLQETPNDIKTSEERAKEDKPGDINQAQDLFIFDKTRRKTLVDMFESLRFLVVFSYVFLFLWVFITSILCVKDAWHTTIILSAVATGLLIVTMRALSKSDNSNEEPRHEGSTIFSLAKEIVSLMKDPK